MTFDPVKMKEALDAEIPKLAWAEDAEVQERNQRVFLVRCRVVNTKHQGKRLFHVGTYAHAGRWEDAGKDYAKTAAAICADLASAWARELPTAMKALLAEVTLPPPADLV